METTNENEKQPLDRKKLLIIIAAAVVVILFLLLGALLIFGGSEEPTPTNPSTGAVTTAPTTEPTDPSETVPPVVEVPVKVWDMENLPENLVYEGMAYANSNDNIYGNLIIGGVEGKGLGGSKAFGYTFVGDYSSADVFVMSPISLKDDTLVTDWSRGEMLWFWVNGSELLQNVRLELTINGKYFPIGPTYYTVDSEGKCVAVDTIPEGWGTTTTRGRIRLNQGWEGWIGIPIEETYGEIKTLTSIQIHVGNSTIKAGNVLYLDEFWLTELYEVPPLSVEELNYTSAATLTNGQIWDLEDVSAGTEVGNVGTTADRSDASSQVVAGKGVAGSNALGYILKTVDNTNSQNLDLVSTTLAQYGFETRAIKDKSDILWFWVDSELSASQMLHLQLNGIFLAKKSVYTIVNNNGTPSIQEVPFYTSKGSVAGVSVVPNNGSESGTYGRIEISAGWSGWIGIPVENFCVNSDGTAADIPMGKVAKLTFRLYGAKNVLKVGDAIYFDEFWITAAGKMPELSSQQLIYGYTASTEKPTMDYGQIWDGGDAKKLTEGTVVGEAGANEDRNGIKGIVAAGKGVAGSNALSYCLTSVGKTNGNNLTLISGELSGLGYKIATISSKTDILWFWVDSVQDADQLLHIQLNDVKVFMAQKSLYTIAPDADGKPVITEIPFTSQASNVISGVGVVPQGNYARIKLCDGWSGWIGIPIENFCVNSDGTAADVSFTKVSSLMIRNFLANTSLLTTGDAIIFDEFWLTKTGTMPGLTDQELLYGYTAVEEVVVNDGGQIWDAGDALKLSDNTSAGTAGDDSGRTAISTFIAEGKGVAGSNALCYNLVGNLKNNGNNLTLTAGDMVSQGFRVTNITNNSDILWFWVDSEQSVAQLLHIQLNDNKVFMAQKAIYTITPDENGKPVLTEVPFSASTALVTEGVGVVPQGGYARIKLCNGWSGWIGIPIENFSVDSNGNTVDVPGTTVSELIFRNYYNPGSDLTVGSAIYFDEFWLTEAGALPGLTDAELLYGYEAPAEPDPDEPQVNEDLIWDLESEELTDGMTLSGAAADTARNAISAVVDADRGVAGSNALAYVVTTTNKTNSNNMDLKADALANYGFQPAVIEDGDVLWFWLDSGLSADQLLHIQLNGSHLAQKEIYTITDVDGKAVLKTIAYNDLSLGMGVTDSNWNGKGTYGRLYISAGWSGWVGIPVSNFDGNNTTVPTGVVEKITFRLYGTADSMKTGDTLYFDAFWLTAAGEMPDLTNEELLYTYTPPVVTELGLFNRYQDGMIFQQNKPWIVDGTGVIGETVTVELIDKDGVIKQTQSATVDENSEWSVTMEAVAGSYDEYTIKITSGNNTKILRNVVFGEVWAAGGQSNMAYTFYPASNGDMVVTEEDMEALQTELASYAKASYIRFFMSRGAHQNGGINEDVVGSWGNGSDWEAVKSCSATAIYFAKALEAELDVPVGVVVGAVGGTRLSAWVDPEIAQADTEFYNAVTELGYVGSDAEQRELLGGWFNARVAAWKGFEVNGFIWYQGAHDIAAPVTHEIGFDVLVDSWSRVFNSEETVEALPLVAVQITPCAYTSDELSVSVQKTNDLNAAMRKGVASLDSETVLVQTYDLTIDVTNHHPKNKPELGARVAAAAMGLVYEKNSVNSGPVLESVDYSVSGQITLTFSNVGGGLKYIQLTAENNGRTENSSEVTLPDDLYVDALNGFSIWTGSKIISVDAEIISDTQIRIILPEDATAVGVAYGHGMEILSANLYNQEGYPAVPFFDIRDDGFKKVNRTKLWNLDEFEEFQSSLTGVEYTTKEDRNTVEVTRVQGAGVAGSNALAYTQTALSGTGAAMSNAARFLTVDSLSSNGFDTSITVSADDDILWFWVHNDMTNDMRLQVTVNGAGITGGGLVNGVNEDIYIYTLVTGSDGEPALKKICHQSFSAQVDTIGLVNPSTAGTGTYSQIKIASGWSGWVGIPVNMLTSGGSVKATDTIAKLEILARMYNNTDGSLTTQQAGDAIYFDEFWLTSNYNYPYLEDLVDFYVPLWDLEDESLTAGTEIGTITSNTNQNSVSVTVEAKAGVAGSNALAYTLTGDTIGKNQSCSVKIDLTKYGFNSSVKVDLDSVLWFWVDSDLSSTQRLHLELNDIRTKIGDYIYTIQADENGKPQIVKVPYQTSDVDEDGDTDGIDGLSFTQYSNTNENNISRIKISNGWSGWVGIPMEYFWKSASSYLKDGAVLSTMTLYLYQNQSNGYDPGTQAKGDVIYLDEFWMTEDGMMPQLTDAELLYDGDREAEPTQELLWNLEEADDTLADGAYSVGQKDTRNQMTLSISQNGVAGSNALSLAIESLIADTDTADCEIAYLTNPTALGFNSVAIQEEDDILWFWVDSDMSADMRLQLAINGKNIGGTPLDTYCIYSIRADADGKPEMYQIKNGSYSTAIDGRGIALVNQSQKDANNVSLIKFYDGWSGWVGIPANMLTGGGLAVGDTVEKIELFLRLVNTMDGSNRDLSIGEAVYFDEFWITSAGSMPKLTDEELLYVGDEVVEDEESEAYRTLLQNFDALTAGDNAGTIGGSSSYSAMTAKAAAEAGIAGSNALAFAYTSGTNNNTRNLTLTGGTDITAATIQAASDILWFWIDSDVAQDRLLHIQLNGSHLAQKDIYTITDVDGVATLKAVSYNDLSLGMGVTDSNWNGQGAYGRVYIAAGWSGWIGIPVENFCGNNTTAPAAESAISAVLLRMYKVTSQSWTAGDTLYFDEFWLTSANAMPGLTNDQLLNKTTNE